MDKLKTKTILGIIFLFLFTIITAIFLYRSFLGSQDMWWINKNKKITLEESKKIVEIYVQKELFDQKIKKEKLFKIADNGGIEEIKKEDVKIRINNWYKYKSKFLTYSLFGLIGVFGSLIMIITNKSPSKKKNKNQDEDKNLEKRKQEKVKSKKRKDQEKKLNKRKKETKTNNKKKEE